MTTERTPAQIAHEVVRRWQTVVAPGWGEGVCAPNDEQIEQIAREAVEADRARQIGLPADEEDLVQKWRQSAHAFAAQLDMAREAIGTENAWDGHARADQLDGARAALVADPEHLARILASRDAGIWDEVCRALAWCLENGPAEDALGYLVAHNPHRSAAQGT